MASPRILFLALALSAGCRASSSPTPAVAQTSAYVVRLGSDTLAVEQFTRVGDRLEGVLVTRYPRAVVTRYLVTLSADGTPALIESSSRLADGGLTPARIRATTVTYAGDSALMQQMRDTLITVRVPAPRAFPYINYSMAFVQLPIAAARAAGLDSVAYTILPVGGRGTTPITVIRRGGTRYDFMLGPYRYQVQTDGRGVVQEVDGRGTTQHFIARRLNGVDVTGIASAWGQRELGLLSTRDTVIASIGPASLWVDYGRPAARGRAVFGADGVLGDTLWRTGANAATQFRTDTPILIGGERVPAGTYTLWTLAVPGRYQLIINRQTGQWGTVYDPARDLARVPLAAAVLPRVMERFTIVVEPTGDRAGTLRLRWDATELSVPISVP